MVASINLSSLNGRNGSVLNNDTSFGNAGAPVNSAGDMNGDGIQDLVVGVDAFSLGPSPIGRSYVVFGDRRGLGSTFNLSRVNGRNGFAIGGITAGGSGFFIGSAGDVNGDELDDLMIGAIAASPNGQFSGQSYIIFGKRGGFTRSINVANLDGRNGFTIDGLRAFDTFGVTSQAGDINGDGIDDFVISSLLADAKGSDSGQVYVIFGDRRGFGRNFNLSSLNGRNGFIINGLRAGNRLGAVSNAGDVNGDGIDDLALGALGASPRGASSGQSYIVFGTRTGFSQTFDLARLNGRNGFSINGIRAGDSAANIKDAGDVNGDGVDDVIIGASLADPNGESSGQAYVVFGKRGSFSPSLNLSSLNGRNGFIINGTQAQAPLSSFQSAGDINADGIDDLIIGANQASSPNGELSGQSYVIFGKRGRFAATLNPSELNGKNGFVINGIAADNNAGRVNSLGDVNGDGIDDVIIGAPGAGANGQSYVIYGGATYGTTGQNNLKGTGKANVIYGFAGDDRFNGAGGNDTLLGGDGNDVMLGGAGIDYLLGEAGTDTYTGGAGRDRFVFDIGKAFDARLIGIDRITDFRRTQDKIVLDKTTFTAIAGQRISFASVGTVAQAETSTALVAYIRSTGALFYNPNRNQAGFGSGGQFADLQNGLNLVASDFVVQA